MSDQCSVGVYTILNSVRYCIYEIFGPKFAKSLVWFGYWICQSVVLFTHHHKKVCLVVPLKRHGFSCLKSFPMKMLIWCQNSKLCLMVYGGTCYHLYGSFLCYCYAAFMLIALFNNFIGGSFFSTYLHSISVSKRHLITIVLAGCFRLEFFSAPEFGFGPQHNSNKMWVYIWTQTWHDQFHLSIVHIDLIHVYIGYSLLWSKWRVDVSNRFHLGSL